MPEDQSRDNPHQRMIQLSVDAEESLVGAALLNQEVIDHTAALVDASDFGQPFYAFAWQTMLDLHKAGTRVTPMIVALRCSTPVVLEALALHHKGVRPIEVLARMAGAATTVINAPDYARAVRECRHRRDLSIAGERLAASMLDPSRPLREQAGECSDAIETAFNKGEAPKQTLSSIIEVSMAALESGNAAPGITTGLKDVDRMIGGFVAGDLIVTGARPSMGKSASSVSMCLGSAYQSHRRILGEIDEEPWGVLFMTHEMTHAQVTQRMLTDLAFRLGDSANPVMYERFRPPPGVKPEPLSWTQREGMQAAAKLLPRLPIAIDGRPGMTIAEASAMVRLHKKRFKAKGLKLHVVAVDHIGLGKLLPVRKHGNRVDELGEITSSLKALAVNDDLCVLALHQLSRANEGRENKRPSLADFRDSGHIEQDADVMVGLYRDAYYLERERESDSGKEQMRLDRLEGTRHVMEYFVLKNRQGRVGMVELWAHMGANAVRNSAYLNEGFQR